MHRPSPLASVFVLALLLAGTSVPLPCHALQESVRIAVFQGPIREGDFPANLASARSLVTRAREEGADFLAFPECFLSGYENRAAVSAGARALEDSELQAFIRESADHNLVVLIGIARREGPRLFNSVLVIHGGRLLGVSDKIHLTPDDAGILGFTPGTTVPVYTARGARFAVIICADSSYPTAALSARLQGAELLFTPHYNEIPEPVADDHRRWVRNCHIGLACQLRMAVARPNVVRTPRHGQVSYGDSFILSPQGEPLAEARLFRPGLITAVISPDMFRPPFVWGDLEDSPGWLRRQVASQLAGFRSPIGDEERRAWLENMVTHHRFTANEVSQATGWTPAEVAIEIKRLAVDPRRPAPPEEGAPLRVLPYPGGRHPRLGFFDGAVAPQRETKVSIFAPWQDGGYVVVDVPEAIFSNLGLTFLAHTHIPTIWDQEGVTLPPREWQRQADGRLRLDRALPNGITFAVVVETLPQGARFSLSLSNGTPELLTGLRVQNCVMLGRASGFEHQTLTNKVFSPPFAAAASDDGRRWVVTGWQGCQRAWGNVWVPCIHADPVFPDCPPGMSVHLRGWLSFHEGTDIQPELARLDAAGVLDPEEPTAPTTP